jgi:hypothetical protein
MLTVAGLTDALEDPSVDQPGEPRGQDIGGQAKLALELPKPGMAQEHGVPHDQQTPSLAHDFEAPSHVAVLAVVGPVQHGPSSYSKRLLHAIICLLHAIDWL